MVLLELVKIHGQLQLAAFIPCLGHAVREEFADTGDMILRQVWRAHLELFHFCFLILLSCRGGHALNLLLYSTDFGIDFDFAVELLFIV